MLIYRDDRRAVSTVELVRALRTAALDAHASPRIGVEHPVEVDADERSLRVVEIDAAHLTIISVMSDQDRQAARTRIADLVSMVRGLPSSDHFARLIEEAEALDRAVAAFHLEGIRFRMYNVDRMVASSPMELPAEVNAAVADIHRHLTAAGFHTRSHQAPTG